MSPWFHVCVFRALPCLKAAVGKVPAFCAK